MNYNIVMKTKNIKQIELSSYKSKKADIFVSKKYLTKDYPLHCHNHFEMEFILSGAAEENINGRSVGVKKGTLYVLKPSDYHAVKIISPLNLVTVSFDYRVFPKPFLQYFCTEASPFVFQTKEEEFDTYKVLFELLYDEYKISEEITACALTVVFEKLKRLSAFKDDSELVKGEQILDAVSYVNLHFNENPSLKSVADLVCYTPEYLSGLFKKATGKTFTQYLKTVKIENAKKLLTLEGLSVAEICFKCGFGSVSNFNRVFKTVTNTVPSEYRKNKKAR